MNKRAQINQEPIFVVGFPRSGTTFLQSLLCTQPGIISFPETHFFNKATGHFSQEHDLTEIELEEVISVMQQKIEHVFDQGILKKSASDHFAQKNVFEAWLVQLAQKQNVDLLDNDYLWVEKTPSHGMHLNKILNYYPRAKVLAMIRNPLHSINSYYNKLVDYRKPYHDLAEEWLAMYQRIEEAKDQFDGRVMMIKYEDLAEKTHDEIKKIGIFIDRSMNVDLLSNFGAEAKNLIVENERWKASNMTTLRGLDMKPHVIPVKNVLQIEYLLAAYFKKYNYSVEHAALLAVYEKYRKLRS